MTRVADPAVNQLADRLLARAGNGARTLVGITGPVCVGKSTLAAGIATRIRRRGRKAAVLCTDAFLRPNDELSSRGLKHRKGFPESFDLEAMRAALTALADGVAEVRVPVYSHDAYDVVPGATTTVTGDVVLVEGLNALGDDVAPYLGVSVYLHADDSTLREWFAERFLLLREESRADPHSFYSAFAGLSDDHLRALAGGVWEGINAPNLREHIAPARERATFVVEKGGDHRIVAIFEQPVEQP